MKAASYMAGLLLPGVLFIQALQGQDMRAENAFSYQANDSTTTLVRVMENSAGVPVRYVSHLVTGVCSDGLCKPVDIHIYWDLLGQFQEYKTSPSHPLTKFDHIPLTAADHAQLHRILADTSSLLRYYAVADMIDTTVKIQSDVVDAVTAATNPTFADATVEGAMYTVYTLWHFVNGNVRYKVRHHTETLLTDSLIAAMLRSGRLDYQRFVYDRLTDTQRRQFAPIIISLIGSEDPYIPHFAIAQLKPEILADSSLQVAAMSQLGSAAAPVQNSLLSSMEGLHLNTKSVQLLLEAVPVFTGSQLDNAFSILESNLPSMTGAAIGELKTLSRREGREYSPFVKKLMQRLPVP